MTHAQPQPINRAKLSSSTEKFCRPFVRMRPKMRRGINKGGNPCCHNPSTNLSLAPLYSSTISRSLLSDHAGRRVRARVEVLASNDRQVLLTNITTYFYNASISPCSSSSPAARLASFFSIIIIIIIIITLLILHCHH